ncbi:hypothetical protein RHD99_07730 [Buttiauxella selenatireducens]|uniref:DUF5666 domain-containing protein n=1 Tax=Buttiauxella selenatireducens TaxID=3073902 RepID=A0ABY9SF96_9ENTR|nr:hypothetical protein [Buttiauxella sp. R73]WMY75821.1 hypothetical protein RHD99_07730 [Buttiauxella sp. R73]
MMNKLKTIALVLGFVAFSASAALPLFNGKGHPGDVHIDQNGPVYLNGKEMKLKKINDNFYEATGQGVVLSIAIMPDGTPSVSWTGKNRAHGEITPANQASATKGPSGRDLDCSRPDLTNAEMKACQ